MITINITPYPKRDLNILIIMNMDICLMTVPTPHSKQKKRSMFRCGQKLQKIEWGT